MDTLIADYFEGRHLCFEHNYDGTVDVVLVSRFGHQIDRVEDATDRDAAAEALLARNP